jgi:hypothetical protein
MALIVASVALFHFYPEYKRVIVHNIRFEKLLNLNQFMCLRLRCELVQDLCLNWSRVLKKGESYRCLTTFLCFGGKFGMHTMLDLMILSQAIDFLDVFSSCHQLPPYRAPDPNRFAVRWPP